MDLSTPRDVAISEPCGGMFSTQITCAKQKRICTLVKMDANYSQAALNRLGRTMKPTPAIRTRIASVENVNRSGNNDGGKDVLL